MSIAISSIGSRQPVTPVRPVEKKMPEEKDLDSLRQERQSLQDQLLLLKGSSDAAASADLEPVLTKRLEEVTRQLQAQSPAAQAPAPRFDRYEPGESGPALSAGLYHPETDEAGNPVIRFEPPSDQESAGSPSPTGEPREETEQTTVNTDKVDGEIERLKKERAQVAQKLRGAVDETEEARLRQELSQLDAELQQKDSDSYRRQHASVLQE